MSRRSRGSSWLCSCLLLSLVSAPVISRAADEPPDAIVVTRSDDRLLLALAPAAARLKQPAVLIASPATERYIDGYLQQRGDFRVELIDPLHRAPAAWRERFRELPCEPTGLPLGLVRRCWTSAPAVVLAFRPNRELAVAASLLAAAREVPAFWIDEPTDVRPIVHDLEASEIVCVGNSAELFCRDDVPNCRVIELKTPEATLSAYETALGELPPQHLVVFGTHQRPPNSNAADIALLSPQYAVHHRAAVAFLNERDETEPQIERLVFERYPSVKYVTLWGDTDELPDTETDDPVTAAGLSTRLIQPRIAVPPLSGLARREPCVFRVGRISGDSLSTVSMLIARNLRPPKRAGEPPRALILANSSYELPLMETITRTTGQSFQAAGWRFDSAYGWQAEWYKRPNECWGADVVVYEGHTANVSRVVQFDPDRDPVMPGLYVFQGCRTLIQPQVTALLRNGAAGVVGTTTKTYSASGSAFAKALVDSMVLDGDDVGTSLMVARNFMLVLAELEERRGHHETPKMIRSGMTFGLWGDPTWHPERLPATVDDPSPRVRAVRHGDRIELKVPDQWSAPIEVNDFMAEIPLGAKLAGMFEWEDDTHARRHLIPVYFAVVPVTDFTAEESPVLSSKLAKNRWASLWDPHNRWLYLAVQGTSKPDQDRGAMFTFRLCREPLRSIESK